MAGLDVGLGRRLSARSAQPMIVTRCEVLMVLPGAGHGARPLPEPGSIASHLLGDPPSFDLERTLPVLHDRIAGCFARTLPAPPR